MFSSSNVMKYCESWIRLHGLSFKEKLTFPSMSDKSGLVTVTHGSNLEEGKPYFRPLFPSTFFHRAYWFFPHLIFAIFSPPLVLLNLLWHKISSINSARKYILFMKVPGLVIWYLSTHWYYKEFSHWQVLQKYYADYSWLFHTCYIS